MEQTYPASLMVQRGVTISGSLEQGLSRYQSGRFSEAVTSWRQAAQDAERQGDWLNQALSLSYLSLAYQKLGEWRQAERAIAHSLERLASQTSLGETGMAALAQVLNTQGGIQLAMGQPEAAFDTWRRAGEVYAQRGDTVGLIGSQINQAQALQNSGAISTRPSPFTTGGYAATDSA